MHPSKTLLVFLLTTLATSWAPSKSPRRVPFPSQDVEVAGAGVSCSRIPRERQARGALRPVHVFGDEPGVGAIAMNECLRGDRKPSRRARPLVFDGRALDSGAVETAVSPDGGAGRVVYFRLDLGGGAGEPDPVVGSDKPGTPILPAAAGRAPIAERVPAPLE